MRFVRIRIDIANGDCLDPFLPEIVDSGLDVILIQRNDDFTVVCHTLLDFSPEITRNERLRLLKNHVEQIRSVSSRKFQNVSKPLSCNQAGLRALALSKRVDDRCRTVEKLSDRLKIDPALLHDLHDTLLKIRRCRVRLFQHQSSLIIDRDQIGKSTSDICCCPHNDFPLLIKPIRNNLQNR